MATSKQGQKYLFAVIWSFATFFFGWQIIQQQHSLDVRIDTVNLVVLFLCTVTLLIQIQSPIAEATGQDSTTIGSLILLAIAFAVILFLIPTRFIRVLFFVLPIISSLVIVFLKQQLTTRDYAYALGLALLAGITGLGEGRIPWASPILWSVLQFLVVLTSLLAGWSILQYTGLRQAGVGKSQFLSAGAGYALKAFSSGILLATPWAFLNLIVSRIYPDAWALRDGWIKIWWQPIFALQPGIAEEAWARIFLVSLFFLLFRRISQPRPAFATAMILMAYWFAYLHTTGGSAAIQNAIMLGTLYSLPLSYLCLYRDLETAIGFHFWIDFLRFAFAYILFNI